MKFPVVWLAGVALLVICQWSSSANANGNLASPSQIQRKELDLRTPFERINRKLKRFTTNLDKKLEKLIQAVLEIIAECFKTEEPTHSFVTPEKVTNELFKIAMEHRPQIEEAFSHINANQICHTPLFARIHAYMWIDDRKGSLNDIVKFFSRFGYPNAYKAIKDYYGYGGCPQDLIDMIPDGPTTPTAPRQQAPPSNRSSSSNVRELLLRERSSSKKALSPFQLPELPELTCELTDIILKFQGTGLIDLAILLDTVIHEVAQKPSLHFLLGKLQEPAKGESFRGLRLLPEIRVLFHQLNEFLVGALDAINFVEFLRNGTGIDLSSFNIIELVMSLVELILWEKYEPAPPYVPPTIPIP